MSCPANLKQLWIFKWEGSCNYETILIHGNWNGYHSVDYKCTQCRAEYKALSVTTKTLIRNGFDVDKLLALRWHEFKTPEKLRKEEV